MKKVFIISIVAILLVVGLSVIAKSNTSSSGFGIFGRYLGEKIKSNDKVVAEADGLKILLSDVALPYFSSMVAYLQSEEALISILNDPNATPEMKERVKESLMEKPDPLKGLNRVSGMKLLCQEIKNKGISIPEERISQELAQIKEGSASEKPNEWTKYHNELLKALGISEDEYLNKYYRILQEEMDLIGEYEKMIDIPAPSSDEISQIMKRYGVDEESAIIMYEDDFKISFVQNREDELAKSAGVKLLDIEAVSALSDCFKN